MRSFGALERACRDFCEEVNDRALLQALCAFGTCRTSDVSAAPCRLI
jgi:hypothetical protein